MLFSFVMFLLWFVVVSVLCTAYEKLLAAPLHSLIINPPRSPLSSSSSSTSVVVTDNRIPLSPPPNTTDALQWVSRNQYCGELTENDVGKRVRLCGWVALHRIHGGLTFVNLRDQTGIVQITTLPDDFPDAHSTMNGLRLEYVVAIEGVVWPRPAESVNKKMKTGTIEVAAEDIRVLNAVRMKFPFLITAADDAKDSAKEEIRLRPHDLLQDP
ncbi:hypothetical protein CQW23_32365 [Capsicum baccatum]|uniref:OB domain-containing protein n=1 Tax=Capsicum baccatum TaxID=33114 RepID=A0A2G2V530_CAPBA|nr:hypothetical protein CQW23_32365 [Capsicum baccatum]